MTIAARLNKLDERERKLLMVLGGVAGVLLVLVAPAAILSALSTKRSENDDFKSVLAAIDDARSTINERKARHDAVLAKYADQTPALAGFIEPLPVFSPPLHSALALLTPIVLLRSMPGRSDTAPAVTPQRFWNATMRSSCC